MRSRWGTGCQIIREVTQAFRLKEQARARTLPPYLIEPVREQFTALLCCRKKK
jgi:hypothetical protein